MRWEVFACQEKNGVPEHMRIEVRKFAEDGLGPCESVERSSRWQRAYRRAKVGEAGGSSSRQERVILAFTFHGREPFGG